MRERAHTALEADLGVDAASVADERQARVSAGPGGGRKPGGEGDDAV
jgi:hypothetical protein